MRAAASRVGLKRQQPQAYEHTKSELMDMMFMDLARLTHDPLGHVMYCYPWGVPGTDLENDHGPRAWQLEILKSIGDQLVAGAKDRAEVIQEAVASGHGIGKSALVAWLVKWALDTMEDTRIVVTAGKGDQLRTKTWPELLKWHSRSITSELFVPTATSLYSSDPEHEKNWRCDAETWSEHNTDTFAGLHNKGKRLVLIFDEAMAVADTVWEVAEGALTDENTEIIWCVFGNPTGNTGRFKDCFGKYRKRWSLGKPRNIDSRTVEGTNKAYIAKLLEDHGEDSDYFKVRVRGMFPNISIRQFISTADVDAAYGRHLRPGQFNFAPKILTLDNAWTGEDEVVIGLRQGLMFKILRTAARNDNDMVIGQLLANLEDEESADAVFIDGGFGTGVASYGKNLQRNWTLVWFAGKSSDPGCFNKRAEMWKGTRDWLKSGGAIPEDTVLHGDLVGPEIVPRNDGVLLLESKEDMKGRGLASPGRGDALALSFAHVVAKRDPASGPRGNRGRTPANHHDYDPYAERK